MKDLKLYTYFRSSAAWRVRIALNLKGLDYEALSVHLLRDGGENWLPEYRELNPQGLVPTLLDGRRVFFQSLSLIEYLEEMYPTLPLLPSSPRDRAQVRSLSLMIACDIHPLNNIRVLEYLKQSMQQDQSEIDAWYCHWVHEGFSALEQILRNAPCTGDFCHGDAPTLADCCLVPQVYNARRYDCDLSEFPTLERIDAHCSTLEAFRSAAPENQPDADAET